MWQLPYNSTLLMSISVSRYSLVILGVLALVPPALSCRGWSTRYLRSLGPSGRDSDDNKKKGEDHTICTELFGHVQYKYIEDICADDFTDFRKLLASKTYMRVKNTNRESALNYDRPHNDKYVMIDVSCDDPSTIGSQNTNVAPGRPVTYQTVFFYPKTETKVIENGKIVCPTPSSDIPVEASSDIDEGSADPPVKSSSDPPVEASKTT